MSLTELREEEPIEHEWASSRPMPVAARATSGEIYVGVGEIVADKYRIERVLGSGGMAFVLSAKHVHLDEHFALKFLNREFLAQRPIVERFTREAKAACKIRSEHVARVYDVGLHDGAPFLVMEHLAGRDLAAVLAERGALEVAEAAEIAMQACVALAVAHSHGIVHRDIKPENLLLVEHEGMPVIKLLDFGISKVALTGDGPRSHLTGQLTLGTPCYMSPEQIRSTASADAFSDQWSLGAVLYELLAGREAFQAETITEVCAAVLETEPPPLAALRPDLPSDLVAVVVRCLAKDPADRFPDVAQLARALLPFAPSRALVCVERAASIVNGARSMKSGEHPVSLVRVARAPVTTAVSLTRKKRAPRRWGRVLVVGLGLAVAAGGVGYRARSNVAAEAVRSDPTTAAVLPAPVAEPPPSAVEPLLAAAPVATHAAPPPALRVVAPSAPVRTAAPRATPSAKPSASVAAATAASTPVAATAAPSVELGY